MPYGCVTSLLCAALIRLRGEVIGTRTCAWMRSISVVWICLWFCVAIWLLRLIAWLLLKMRLLLWRIVADPARRGR